jgi:hypothetical protein
MRYDSPMSTRWITALTMIAACTITGVARAAEPPALAKARTLYNESNFEGAIDAAAVSRRQAGWADASALVIGRSHLERYRQRRDPKDLAAAREALITVRLAMLMPRDQVDLIIGLGLSLYHGEVFGAAGNLFDTALTRGTMLPPRDRRQLLDWWATALDRQAQAGPADRRRAVFERIAARMDEELKQDPGGAVALYWRAVATRGAGDLSGAWDYAIAGWVQSTLEPDTSESLRGDLDRLVQQALIPERSRLLTRDPQEAVSTLRNEWELVKQQWK